MSDQGKWAKLWVSTLADPDLENLELHQWARWARLIIFMKAHGTNGKLVFDPPFRALQTVLRVESWDALCEAVRHCPGFTILQPSHQPSHEPSHYKNVRHMIVCRNWYKFQGDMSVSRMNKLRKKGTVTSTVTCDGKSDGLRREEKRREVTSTSTSPPALRASPPLGGAVATRESEKTWRDLPESERMTPEDFQRAKEEIVRAKLKARKNNG